MNAAVQNELHRRYLALRASYMEGRIDQGQFMEQAGSLVTRDGAGTWWGVNARDGSLLRYDGREWLPAGPDPGAPPAAPQPATTYDRLVAWLSLIVPLITAACWLTYSLLVPSEQNDCITPLILAGIPLMFIYFRRPIDRLLLPVQPLRRPFPKFLLYGMSLTLPLVLAYVAASLTQSGYGVARFVALVSLLAGYALVRDPEVAS